MPVWCQIWTWAKHQTWAQSFSSFFHIFSLFSQFFSFRIFFSVPFSLNLYIFMWLFFPFFAFLKLNSINLLILLYQFLKMSLQNFDDKKKSKIVSTLSTFAIFLRSKKVSLKIFFRNETTMPTFDKFWSKYFLIF